MGRSASLRTTLLAGTAFMGGILGFDGPQTASAVCTINAAPNQVTCVTNTATSDTINMDAATGASNDRHQRFTANGDILAAIQGGVVVSNAGLAISTIQSGAAIDFTHLGSVNQTIAATEGGLGALVVFAAFGGSVTYSGNGSVTTNQTSGGTTAVWVVATNNGTVTFGTAGTPISAAFASGYNGIQTNTDLGANSVVLNDSTVTVAMNGVTARSSSGAVDIALRGNTSITGGLITGVTGSSDSGAVTIESNAAIGSAGTRFESGLIADVDVGAGTTSVTQTGGAVFASTYGISATTGGTGDVSIVQTGGTIDAGTAGTGVRGEALGTAGAVDITVAGGGVAASRTGVFGAIAGSTNAADVNLVIGAAVTANSIGARGTHNGTGAIVVGGTGSIGGGTTAGIQATHTGSGPAAGTNGILIGGSGNTTATSGAGIDAQINNVANASDIRIERTGAVTVTGTERGILAIHNGTGNIIITGVGAVTGGVTYSGIDANASGGAITITPAGTVSGANGIRAFSNGGAVAVTTGGQVTGTSGSGFGIVTASGAGTTTIIANHVVTSAGSGVVALGSGSILVQANADIIGTAGTGVDITGAGAAVTNTALISGAIGIRAGASTTNEIHNTGTITGTGGTAVQFTAGTGNLLSLSGPSAALNGTAIGHGSDILRLTGPGTNAFNAGQIGAGFTTFQKQGTSSWTLTGTGNASQNWTIAAGTLRGTSNSIQGTAITNNAALVFDQTFSGSYAGAISGTGTVAKEGNGVLTLAGTHTYNGATTVTAGTLYVNGSTAASATTVNAGATLGGTGTVGNTTIAAGGTLAAGHSIGTLTVQGNLTFATAAAYLVELSPTAADRTNVTGTAALAGTATLQLTPGAYAKRTYTILSAAGGRSGTFDTLASPAGFQATLSYTPTDVIVNLTASLGAGGLNRNQTAVANGLNTTFNTGGALPPSFVAVFGLGGTGLAGILSQLSGEVRAGATQAAFQSTQQFLTMMLDPFAAGRAGGLGGPLAAAPGGPLGVAPLGFAADAQAQMPEEVALAYAKTGMPVKASPMAYEPRWSVWGGAYGGAAKADGDASVGSSTTDSRTGGFAAGADYRLWPDTVVGFALAGGGTSWSLANGGGRSDTVQAGLYGAQRFGAAYLSAALAYAWHDTTTTRSVSIGPETLEGRFRPHVLSGRAEAGYRFGFASWGLTPYLAAQVQSFRAPGYTETATAGAGTFALVFGSQTQTATRTEIGLWADHRARVTADTELLLRGRAAWAHDYDTSRRISPGFVALPGAAFTIDGAAPSPDLALLSAVAELRMQNGLSLSAKFDGEFGARSESYAATGTLRYRW